MGDTLTDQCLSQPIYHACSICGTYYKTGNRACVTKIPRRIQQNILDSLTYERWNNTSNLGQYVQKFSRVSNRQSVGFIRAVVQTTDWYLARFCHWSFCFRFRRPDIKFWGGAANKPNIKKNSKGENKVAADAIARKSLPNLASMTGRKRV